MSGNYKLNFFYCLATLLMVMAYSDLNAQSSLNYQWYINANAGFSQLHGDIQNETNHYTKLMDETGLGFGIRVGKYISPVFSGHIQFLAAEFKGQKDQNSLEFNTNLMEYQLGGTVNLINLFAKNKERRFNVYGLAGFGLILFRSESTYIDGDVYDSYGFTENGDKDKMELSFVFPLGAGLDIKLAERWYVNLETAIRFSLTDKLDAAVKGDLNDAYYYTSLGVSYNFARKKKEKEIVEPPPLPIVVDTNRYIYVNENVNLVYKIPDTLKSLDEFEMRCEIHKGKIDGPGELTQILPIGFDVLDTTIANARVDFKNYTLHLYWDELPKSSMIPIRYKVKLDKIYGKLPLSSILFFENTDKYYRFKTNVSIARHDPDELATELEIAVNDEPMSPANPVEFRIQVRASYKSNLSTQELVDKYNLKETVDEHKVGNWYKYFIGSFDNYKDAKNFKKIVINEHGVRGAFIVAFFKDNPLSNISELQYVAPEAYPIKTTPKKPAGPCFKVQILAVTAKGITTESLQQKYNLEEQVNEEVFHNWRKFTVGECTPKKEALSLMRKMQNLGIKDAFLVVYKNGERVAFDDH